MALTGDRYVRDFQGHTIELIRNNWVHVLSLYIDGVVVDKQSCHFPGAITLKGTLEVAGKQHEVVAKSVPRRIFWTTDIVEVDGEILPLQKTK